MTDGPDPLRDRYFGHEHITYIRPSRGWRMLDFKELWAYRELLVVLAVRDVKVRYKQTVLGVGWAVIQPVMLMLVFSLFFGRLAKMPSDGLPYPVFAYAALLPWTFFANALGASASSVVGASNLVSKVYFPRLIIPLASVGSWLIDLLIATLILLGLMLYYGVGWSWNLLAAPVLVVAVLFTALGAGTLLAALNVAYRDFRYVVPFLLQFWMFATPVVYPASLVPAEWHWVLNLNPMAGLVEGFRSAFLGRPFDGDAILLSFAAAVAMFLAGVAYFEKVERRFADII
jgi:lipopolysaccharide transport system permease protein